MACIMAILPPPLAFPLATVFCLSLLFCTLPTLPKVPTLPLGLASAFFSGFSICPLVQHSPFSHHLQSGLHSPSFFSLPFDFLATLFCLSLPFFTLPKVPSLPLGFESAFFSGF